MISGGMNVSGKAAWGRWALLTAAVLAPVALAAACLCVRWGQLALEAVQVALKMAVIP